MKPSWRWPVTFLGLVVLASAATVVDLALIPPHEWSVSINKGAVFVVTFFLGSILLAVIRRYRR